MVRHGKNGPSRQSLNLSLNSANQSNLIEDSDWNEITEKFNGLGIETNNHIVWPNVQASQLEKLVESVINQSSNQPIYSLVTGPPESGKTTIICEIARKFANKLTFIHLDGLWVLEKQFGNPELTLRKLARHASSNSPTLLFIENFELIAEEKKTKNYTNHNLSLIIESILNYFNSLSTRILILAEVGEAQSISNRLLKNRFFSEDIRFSLPSREHRFEYFNNSLKLSKDQYTQLVDLTHCYSYGDLAKIIRNFDDDRDQHFDEILEAIKKHKPLAIRSVTASERCKPLRWEEIGGFDYAKEELERSVIWPLKNRHLFKEMDVTLKGAILYGPPGCSKTMLARALATESGFNFIYIKGPELYSKYVGDSEAAVRRIYQNARDIAPCLVFIDEIDEMAPVRENNSSMGTRLTATLLLEIDGADHTGDVFTIGATNRPHCIDPALLRSGRLELCIYIPLPTKLDRRAIFKLYLEQFPSTDFDDSLDVVADQLSENTHNYAGADITSVCKHAYKIAKMEGVDTPVAFRHFKLALEKVKPKTHAHQLKVYENFQSSHKKPR